MGFKSNRCNFLTPARTQAGRSHFQRGAVVCLGLGDGHLNHSCYPSAVLLPICAWQISFSTFIATFLYFVGKLLFFAQRLAAGLPRRITVLISYRSAYTLFPGYYWRSILATGKFTIKIKKQSRTIIESEIRSTPETRNRTCSLKSKYPII